MKKTVIPVIMLYVFCIVPLAQAETLPSIFNGKDLSGWVVPENNIWWKAEHGVLKIRSGPKKKGSTLWTQREYATSSWNSSSSLAKGLSTRESSCAIPKNRFKSGFQVL